LEGIALKDVGLFYGHLVYFTDIWYISWPFGILCDTLVYFSRFGMLYQEKSGNPDNQFCGLVFELALSVTFGRN
jgi:hypothetical protein